MVHRRHHVAHLHLHLHICMTAPLQHTPFNHGAKHSHPGHHGALEGGWGVGRRGFYINEMLLYKPGKLETFPCLYTSGSLFI